MSLSGDRAKARHQARIAIRDAKKQGQEVQRAKIMKEVSKRAKEEHHEKKAFENKYKSATPEGKRALVLGAYGKAFSRNTADLQQRVMGSVVQKIQQFKPSIPKPQPTLREKIGEKIEKFGSSQITRALNPLAAPGIESLGKVIGRPREAVREFPREAFNISGAEDIYKFGRSVQELPNLVMQMIRGKEWQAPTYKVPLIGERKSFIGESQERTGAIIEGKEPVYNALKPFAQVPLAGAQITGLAKTPFGKKVGESLKRPGLTIKEVKSPLHTKARGKSEEEFVKAQELSQTLRGTKGMTADDIMKTYPNIKLTKDVPATDIYGNKVKIPEGEKLTPYELKGNKILLQDGETYIVSKNQFQNIKGQSVGGEAKPFAPELEGLDETVKTTERFLTEKDLKQVLREKDNFGTERYVVEFKTGQKYIAQPHETRQTALANAYNANIRAKGMNTKYSQYQLPNGKNYREVLIKAPKDKTNLDPFGNPYPTFQSSHWDEPNVISHLRLNERTYKGKKVTFMEELQSDWAREGRDKGFGLPELSEEEIIQRAGDKGFFLNERKSGFIREPIKYRIENKNGVVYETFTNKKDALGRLEKELNHGTIPNNSNLKNWQELSIKRALKDAVDNKSDYFAWITGEQTSARYNLATHLEKVNIEKNGINKNINIVPKNNKPEFNIKINKDGKIIGAVGNSEMIGKNLDEVLGKGLADKIMEKESGTLSGEGLKFGGEWANNLYDKQTKNIVEKLTGQKVEMMDMGLPIDNKTTKFVAWQRSGIVDVTPENLRVGVEIMKDNGGRDVATLNQSDKYIITDILGDGKFKAVPKSAFTKDKGNVNVSLTGWTKMEGGWFYKSKEETFDISQKTTRQMGIRLTPEVKAKIQGKAPVIKTSGKMFEDTTSQLTSIRKEANKGIELTPQEAKANFEKSWSETYGNRPEKITSETALDLHKKSIQAENDYRKWLREQPEFKKWQKNTQSQYDSIKNPEAKSKFLKNAKRELDNKFIPLWKEANKKPVYKEGYLPRLAREKQEADRLKKAEEFFTDHGRNIQSAQEATSKAKQTIPKQESQTGAGGGQGDIPKSSSLFPNVSSDEDLVKRMTESLKKAKPIRGEQEALYTKARGQKLAKMMGVRGKMAGEKGFFAEKAALSGELPKVHYESIRKEFTQENVDRLFNMVKENKSLDEWDKIAAQEGLSKILGEKGAGVPTRGEIEKMYQVFGKDFTETLLSKRPFIEKFKEGLMQAYNIPRSMMAGFGDFSATLMQNLVFAYRHPVKTAKNFGQSLKYFGSEKFYNASMQEIAQRPNYDLFKRAKISFTDVSPIIQKREEEFMAPIVEKIPGFGKVIRATGRAYTGFLNKMRADVADQLIEAKKLLGDDFKSDRFLQSLGTFVNAGTGRGNLGSLEKSASILAQGFFSARKLVATFNLINPAFYVKADPLVRKEALKTMLAFFGGATAITALAKLCGAEVNTDITSSDFGKIKVGNTRINLFGTYQQIAVLMGRMYKGYATSSTTGRKMILGDEEQYKPMTRMDLLTRFFETKEHPTLSYLTQGLQGKNAFGENFKWDEEALQRFMPMVLADTYDLYKEHGSKGLWGAIPMILGLPTQTYGTEIPKTGETKTGKPKIEWEQRPELAESILNWFKGKRPSDIPENEWNALRESRAKENQFKIELENYDKRSPEAKKLITDYIKTLSSKEEIDRVMGGLSLQGYDTDGIPRSKDILDIKDKFDEIKKLDLEGNQGEADKLINSLSDEDYDKYEKADKAWRQGNSTEMNKLLKEKNTEGMFRKLMEVDVEEQDRLIENMDAKINKDESITDEQVNAFDEAVKKMDDVMSDPEKIQKYLDEQEKELGVVSMEDFKAMPEGSEERKKAMSGVEKLFALTGRLKQKASAALGKLTDSKEEQISIPEGSLAWRNNNPGNLRFAGQTGASEGEGRFAKFETPQEGYKALQKQIEIDKERDMTVREFVSKYAPPSENNTTLYIQQFNDNLGSNENTHLKDLDTKKVAKFMAMKESSTKIGEQIASNPPRLNTKENSVLQEVASGKKTATEAKIEITQAFEKNVSKGDENVSQTAQKIALMPPVIPYSNIGYIPPEKMYDVFSTYGLIAALKMLQNRTYQGFGTELT